MRPQILFLDAYDSFTNNIVSLLTTLLDADVHVLPIDTPLLDPKSPDFAHAFRRELAHYHAVVCGPGPGSPDHEADVGLIRAIWALSHDDLLPVLGVCLGFQSLVLSAGAGVRRLRRGLHGMVRSIDHDKPAALTRKLKGDIFHAVPPFSATLYHSLCADVGQDAVPAAAWPARRWDAPSDAPDLLPLAWASEDRGDGEASERILMAVKHREKPFWGVQYHPESVCTHAAGHAVLQNWFREAMRWNAETQRDVVTAGAGSPLLARNATRPSLLSEVRRLADQHGAEVPWTETTSPLATVGLDCAYTRKTLALPSHLRVPDLVEMLRRGTAASSEHIILDSANADKLASGAADVRGRYSVIALDVDEALRIEHRVGDAFATARIPCIQGVAVDRRETVPLTTHHRTIWQLLADFVARRTLDAADDDADADTADDTPFRGGFMGYVSYEMGLAGIDVDVAPAHVRGHRRPDLCFAWITRSLVVDHARGLLHVQHLQNRKLNADFWIDATVAALQAAPHWAADRVRPAPGLSAEVLAGVRVTTPSAAAYDAKVRRCQDLIAAGESYELCLTDETTVSIPRPSSSGMPRPSSSGMPRPSSSGSCADTAWTLYRTLRTRQPAPFGAFVRLGGATVVSSSPERFLEHDARGACSMRPMKGTVRKSAAVATLAAAEAILHVPKEEAENLMIVDLVRHDLHGVCGPGRVAVPHLMRVEEYASVFQMITVVDARLPDRRRHAHPHTGLDVLAASLPPGSMTGAPKKRSCELLAELEGRGERGLYSGVIGYMDVTGRGDWSVTIRTMWRWDDEDGGDEDGGDEDDGDVWHIGAGGAVTILSTPEGETEEMFTKLAGPLGVFSQ
ncbi:Aminodeoxychorismate synthase like protein [Verticillium longisporum]|uniref:aminodeoxychorismate synthase n=1 Tax=Verticillium longisporum TaxID=100787 RepID=A0A8I2Z8R3_VERLO|nr:Aminodeoxychorismate synthase like protein [Verticillium longisporum]